MTDADWRDGRTRDDLQAMLVHLRGMAWMHGPGRWFGAACLRRIWDLLTDERFRQLVIALEGWASGVDTQGEFNAARERLPRIPRQWPREPDPPPRFHHGGTVRIGGVSTFAELAGVVNFHELPLSVRLTHVAVQRLAGLDFFSACQAVADAVAAVAADGVPPPEGLADCRAKLTEARAALWRDQADAHHRGLSDDTPKLWESRRQADVAEGKVAELEYADRMAREAAANAARDSEHAAQANLLRCVTDNPLRTVAFDPNWRTETVTSLARGIVADCAFDRLPILADALEEAGCDDPDVLSHCRTPGPHTACWVLAGLTS